MSLLTSAATAFWGVLELAVSNSPGRVQETPISLYHPDSSNFTRVQQQGAGVKGTALGLFREVGVSNGSHNERLVPADSQSRRDCVLQPRVARNELPWEIVQTASQPQRGCGRARHPRTQFRWGWLALARCTRDARGASQEKLFARAEAAALLNSPLLLATTAASRQSCTRHSRKRSPS